MRVVKRDLIIALVVGLGAGIVFAFLIINLPQIVEKLNTKKQPTLPLSPTPYSSESQQVKSLNLEIYSPKDGEILKNKKASIKGKILQSSTLVLESPLETKVTESSNDGSFEETISINEGGNNIYITGYNDKGDEEGKTITVFYMEENL